MPINRITITLESLGILDALGRYDAEKGFLRRIFGDEPHIAQLKAYIAKIDIDTDLALPQHRTTLFNLVNTLILGRDGTLEASLSGTQFQTIYTQLYRLLPGLNFLYHYVWSANNLYSICNDHSEVLGRAISIIGRDSATWVYKDDLEECAGAAAAYAALVVAIYNKSHIILTSEQRASLKTKTIDELRTFTRELKGLKVVDLGNVAAVLAGHTAAALNPPPPPPPPSRPAPVSENPYTLYAPLTASSSVPAGGDPRFAGMSNEALRREAYSDDSGYNTTSALRYQSAAEAELRRRELYTRGLVLRPGSDDY